MEGERSREENHVEGDEEHQHGIDKVLRSRSKIADSFELESGRFTSNQGHGPHQVFSFLCLAELLLSSGFFCMQYF